MNLTDFIKSYFSNITTKELSILIINRIDTPTNQTQNTENITNNMFQYTSHCSDAQLFPCFAIIESLTGLPLFDRF